MVLVGSKKMLLNDEMNIAQRLAVYYRGFAPMKGTDPLGNVNLRLFDDGVFAPSVSETEPLRLECQDFIECIKHGRRPVADGKSGLQTVKIIEAVQQSLGHGGREVPLT
jgi:predicted dehydrogenase